MFSSALIVFRETLEAALLIGIIAAATRGLPFRNRWIGLGIAGGITGALLVATLMDRISAFAEGTGQELFKASVLGVAVLMLAWHQIWMSTHGAEMAHKAKTMGRAIQDGTQALTTIALVISLAVLREGSETVLFLYGIAVGTHMPITDLIGGLFLGLLGGILAGTFIYAGLIKIPVRHLFTVTGGLLLMLAAGLSSQMAQLLIQIDWLPSLASPLWNTSWLLSDTSALGTALNILIGYKAQPTGMQAVFYGTTILIITLATQWVRARHSIQGANPALKHP